MSKRGIILNIFQFKQLIPLKPQQRIKRLREIEREMARKRSQKHKLNSHTNHVKLGRSSDEK